MQLTTLTELNRKYRFTEEDTEIIDECFGSYNCMGFAFGSYEWDKIDSCGYYPDEDVDKEIYRDDEATDEDILLSAVDDVLSYSGYCPEYWDKSIQYPDIRFIGIYTCKSKEQDFLKRLKKGEYLVAMRLAEDDFHFARRMEDGSWWHKPGDLEIRKMENPNLYSISNWCDRYYGNIAIFAVRPHQVENEVE